MKEKISSRIKRLACSPFSLALEETDSCLGGLTWEKAQAQRKKYGGNDPVSKSETTVLSCIRRAFINPFTVILFVLALLSFITDFLLPENLEQGLSSVFIICLMLVLSGVVRLTQELRAKRVSDRLMRMVETTVAVRRNGEWKELSSKNLVIGDIVKIEAGDKVPADIRLTDAKDLFVSQSIITGESRIFEKEANELKDKPHKISDYKNIAFQETTVIGGSGIGVVIALGLDTVYGSFAIAPAARHKDSDWGVSSIAWVLIKFMIVLIPIVFIICGITGKSSFPTNWIESFLFSLAVAVGLTPEMLPMVVNACLAKGSYQMGQKQTVVKNINAMQVLGSMDLLCVDKTGTLTKNKVKLEYYMDVLGNDSEKVLEYAFLNSYYHSSVKNHIDTAIRKCRNMPEKKARFEELIEKSELLDEQPFDYSRRYAGVLLKGEKENLHIIKGSIENVVEVCTSVNINGEVNQINGDTSNDVNSVVSELTKDGMKVIAVAYRKTQSSILSGHEKDFTLLGYLSFFDAPKKHAAEAIGLLKKLNVDIRVLTGDNLETALSICSRMGIGSITSFAMEKDAIMTGEELETINENDIPIRIENTIVFAELDPTQKEKIVEILKKNGHSVGFLGDGMNDLAAVIKANVGISVDTAADSIKESADVILLKKDLNVLEKGILEGRIAFTNISKYIKITASSNFGNICAVVLACALLPFLPMTSLQLLILNLIYDIICLILPWDNVDTEQLETSVRWTGKKLARFMLNFGPVSSFFDALTFVFLFFVVCPNFCGGSFSELNLAGKEYFIKAFQTGWFLESIWTQVLILYFLRTRKIPFIQSRPSLPVFIVTIIGILVCTLLAVTHLGRYIGFTSLPPIFYVFLVFDVLFYMVSVSAVKHFFYKKNRELL